MAHQSVVRVRSDYWPMGWADVVFKHYLVWFCSTYFTLPWI